VLLVDDEHGIRETLGLFLERDGHQVRTVADAPEAIKILASESFDAVVSDIVLPQISGVELLEKIRQVAPYTKVILITGEPTVNTAAQAVRMGAFDYLSKPISREDICKAVKSAIRMKNIEDENRAYKAMLEGEVVEKNRQLFQQERRYSTILDAVPDLIFSIRFDGVINYANREVLKRIRLSREQFGSARISDFVPEKNCSEVSRNLIELARRKNHSEHMLLNLISADDQVFTAETSAIIVEGDDYISEPVVLAVGRDVTERLEMERKVQLEHEKHLALFNRLEEIIWVVDPQTYEVLFVNNALKRKLGFDPVGRRCYEALQGYDKPCHFCKNRELLINSDAPLRYEYYNRALKNHFMASEGLLTWPDGRQVKVSLSFDVTSRLEAEARLMDIMHDIERSNAELEQFAYVASHDLQEPLRKIKSFTELLANRYAEHIDERADKYIHYIVDGTDRMQKLIDDLLTYSRVGTKAQPFSYCRVDALLDQAVSNTQLMINESGASIIRSGMPELICDSVQIVQVFQNLISNAIKFRSEKAPEIRISAEKSDCAWVFSISDNGIGIPQDQQDRIFEIFQRLQLHDEYPGTGIGLAICKKIIERHGGRIWVESEPGKGSTFRFTISELLVSGGVN